MTKKILTKIKLNIKNLGCQTKKSEVSLTSSTRHRRKTLMCWKQGRRNGSLIWRKCYVEKYVNDLIDLKFQINVLKV